MAIFSNVSFVPGILPIFLKKGAHDDFKQNETGSVLNAVSCSRDTHSPLRNLILALNQHYSQAMPSTYRELIVLH